MMLWETASVHFNSLHCLGTKPIVDKSTPYVYLLPHCHRACIDIARCFMWSGDRISEAQTACSIYEYNTHNICLTKVLPKPALHRLSYEVCQIEALLFVCAEWITCSYSCLFWGCNTHSWALQPRVNWGHCLLYQLELCEFLITSSRFHNKCIYADPISNKSQLFLLIKW